MVVPINFAYGCVDVAVEVVVYVTVDVVLGTPNMSGMKNVYETVVVVVVAMVVNVV